LGGETLRALLSLLFVGLFAITTSAWGYNCSKSCEDQCRKGFIGNNVDPVCYAGCRAYMVASCYDISDPYVSAMGEVGQNAYVAAASTMQSKNPQWGGLDRVEKEALKPFFGDLVNKVRLHWGSQLMDKWGNPPYEISLGDSAGQTYGLDIYLAPTRASIDVVDRIALIGHEMQHSQQYLNMGSSLHQFGRKYFESFARNGSYDHISFEKEAYAIESKIAKAAGKYIEQSAVWDFVVCNKSDASRIYVAVAYDQGGLTLVQSTESQGWYPVDKGQCKKIVSNQRGDNPLYAYATTRTQGGGLVWSGKSRRFCIDQSNAFTVSHLTSNDFRQCEKPNLGVVGFASVPNPWRESRNGTYRWNLVGSETVLKVCNETGEAIYGAQLRSDSGIWKSNGWQAFSDQECKTWNLGGYTGSVYLYGENAGPTKRWQDKTQPAFCVFHPNAFEHIHSQPCKGGTQVNGYRYDLKPGPNSWTYRK
jgi:uncharacterized membrane protein